MARRSVHPSWLQLIRWIAENDPGATVRSINEELRALSEREGWRELGAPPGTSTIRRIMAGHAAAPEEQRAAYRGVRWPETFERGDLPWEASAAVLALTRWLQAHLAGPLVRPSVPGARRYWHVTRALPDAPLEDRVRVAGLLALCDRYPDELRHLPRVVERWLIDGAIDEAAWRAMVDDGRAVEQAHGGAACVVLRDGTAPPASVEPGDLDEATLLAVCGHWLVGHGLPMEERRAGGRRRQRGRRPGATRPWRGIDRTPA